nr:hypothetical protein [Polaromonas sp. H6N]
MRWALCVGTPHLEVDASSAADNDGKVDKTAGSSSAHDLKAA